MPQKNYPMPTTLSGNFKPPSRYSKDPQTARSPGPDFNATSFSRADSTFSREGRRAGTLNPAYSHASLGAGASPGRTLASQKSLGAMPTAR